jgi:serine/threonine protein kinase/Tfp pilus assembly protein PilF
VIGKQLGHYRVLEPLGRGGMGEVYVAEDIRLARHVALKVPRHDVAASLESRARLQREARAAAALNHPNIVHLYSVEESEGVLFMTMELVRGRSLRELLSTGGPLPLPKTLAYATQMTDGLECAHSAGVLHRDLKPGNIVITDGDQVKLLDFGLAKLSAPVGGASDPEAITLAGEASTPGMTLGTVGYMSPEQAVGQSLDHRTDLFALGVVLYEMATGRAPFAGETPAAVFDQLLNRRPPSPRALNPAVPAFLDAIIEKALEKDPQRRYQSATDLLRDLTDADRTIVRATQPGSPADTRVEPRSPASVVVLPFVDLSPGKDQVYFCHGISEEIISMLTRVPGVRVISRTSAFAFEGKDVEVTEIGRRLRVGAALEGSVRRAGDRVRVTVQLVDTEHGSLLWSKRFDRELSDVFAIQDEIAETIVQELRIGLVGVSAARRTSRDAAAHDAYLKGLYALHKWTEPSVRQAITDFGEVIARDPRFAPAFAALADAHIWLYSGIGLLPAGEAVPRARRAVEQALTFDPLLAEAHKARGLIAMNHDWDRRGAAEAFARALELAPGSAALHLWDAWRLALLERRHDQALIELEEAERLDPLDLQVKTQIGYVHLFHHDVDRAIAQFARVSSLEPAFAFAHYALGDACLQQGDYARAFAAFEKAIELGGRSVNHIGVLGYAYGKSGQPERARGLLDELIARTAASHVSPMWIAMIHLGLGDQERLFASLDRAFEERDGSLILITAAVEFDPVREEPRFTSLLTRMGLGHLAGAVRTRVSAT